MRALVLLVLAVSTALVAIMLGATKLRVDAQDRELAALEAERARIAAELQAGRHACARWNDLISRICWSVELCGDDDPRCLDCEVEWPPEVLALMTP